MALTQLSLTLHFNRKKIYILSALHSYLIFILFYFAVDELPALIIIVYNFLNLIFRILLEYGCIHLTSTNK